MQRSPIKTLAFKIFLAVLAAMVALVAGMLALTYTSLGRGFQDYIRAMELERAEPLVEILRDAYVRDGDWEAIPKDAESFRRWLHRQLTATDGFRPPQGWLPGDAPGRFPPPPRGAPPPEGLPPPARAQGEPPGPERSSPRFPRGAPPPDRLGLTGRIALLDIAGDPIAGPHAAEGNPMRRPIAIDGTVVGWVALTPGPVGENDLAGRFLRDQRRNMLLISGLSVALSGLLAGLLAAHVRRPVKALVASMRRLAAGHYDTRTPEDRGDELGDLARTLNQLGNALERYEGMRRQWVADTSHELRTPITVLRARIEAMQDGVHAVEPNRLGGLHRQVMNLSALVDDLYTLARADLGRLEVEQLPVEPLSVLEEVLEAFRPRLSAANLALEIDCPPASSTASPWIAIGDERRLSQLFNNLLENSLRYCDPGGRIRVVCTLDAGTLNLAFHDTPPGVPPAELARLFDRFYRVESSRNRASGGSGLGLALCRTIVLAHGGTIAARPSPLGGLCIEIRLPPLDQGETRR